MLTLQPDASDSRAVFLRHPELDGDVRLLMWEKIYFLNWAKNGWRSASGQPTPFAPTTPSGGLRRELRSPDGVFAELVLEPRDDETIAVTLSATNITPEINDPFWGAFDLRHLWFDLCAHYRNVESLRDPDFSRTFISVNGRPTPLCETELTGHRKAITGYWLKNQPRELRTIPELHSTYGTGISPTESEETWLAVESRDKRFTLLTAYPRVNNLWANRREPMHGCIHANALLGDIAIGQTARTTGLIVLAKCKLNDAIERARSFLRDSTSTL